MAESRANQTLIAHYRIRSRIGAGGMGEVFLAEDAKLGRLVALKILPAEVAADAERLRRFTLEAKAASALSHANVAQVYEIGEADGLHFIAMEYVSGQTLHSKINHHPLDNNDLLDISLQIADALDEAHAKGIIHRDLKPANLMITTRGQVKVLDFGLAKITVPQTESSGSDISTAHRTSPGVVMGTVQYMSPEQALGRAVDGRSDLFSFGVVMYEMATGRLPFSGAGPTETIEQITHTQPEAIGRLNYNIPAELERIIRKCLEKEPERRYQAARDLLVDLKNCKRDSDSGATTTSGAAPQRRGWSLKWISVTALVMVVLAAIVWYLVLRSNPSANYPIHSIAVLPLVNANADPNTEYLSDGISETLINSLSQLAQLKVMASTTAFRYRGVDPQTVGRDLKVDAVLTGKVIQQGEALLVQVNLVNAIDGSQIWGEQYSRKLANLVALQSDIAGDVSAKLRVKLSGADEQKVTKSYTANPEAYQLYLRGRFHWNKRTPQELQRAIEYFQQAIAVDPSYALAYSGLADAYSALAVVSRARELMPKAKEAARKALLLDDNLAEAHATLGVVLSSDDYDFAGAEREYKRALELNPNYATVHHWYGSWLVCQGRFDDGLAEYRRALEIEPLSFAINFNYGFNLYFARRYDEAITQAKKTQELDANSPLPHYILSSTYSTKGMYPEAVEEMAKCNELLGNPQLAALLRERFAKGGMPAYWRALLGDNNQLFSGPFIKAACLTALGEKDQAFAELNKAYDNHDAVMVSLKVNPLFDPLRDDPRFKALLARVGFPQ